MTSSVLAPTIRLRRTPFWDRVERAGVQVVSIYNHMLMPCMFESPEEDYRHLKGHVQVWDVSCERQVRLRGPDAQRLAQMMTPRWVGDMDAGQCLYVPAVDRNGFMLNDPVLLKLAADQFWFSLADSDLLLYALGIAGGAGLDVEVDEPDISPLGVQGPKAGELMSRVFGHEIYRIPFFRFGFVQFNGIRHAVSRSGFSKQGGFEIYVDGAENGVPVWDALMEAGRDLGVRAGGPNYAERIEAGLLSYGSDITRENTPHEAGLSRFCDTERSKEFLGRESLLRLESEGPKRQIRCVSIDGDKVPACDRPWRATAGRRFAGTITSATWSPDFETNVAIGMIEAEHWDPGTRLVIELPDGSRTATVRGNFYI
ncbi:MAG: dimethylsulfoniopropionate demethylase [Rhodobacteraceae bacterium]|nr:dimethylsulfoniopropionate demethylase [Paracoccaceae bacterium]